MAKTAAMPLATVQLNISTSSFGFRVVTELSIRFIMLALRLIDYRLSTIRKENLKMVEIEVLQGRGAVERSRERD